MKKVLFAFFLLSICSNAFAKKVKFVVDMNDTTLPSTGVFILGDFQKISGVASQDWMAGICQMDSVGNSLFEYVVDIPAFRMYMFKCTYGNGYDYETVPNPSKLEPWDNSNIDNRWFYLDSLNNDTTIIGGYVFGGNAPRGQYLLRTRVVLPNVAAGTAKPYVLGSFNNWDTTSTALYNIDSNNVYDGYVYVDTGFSGIYAFTNENKVIENIAALPCASASGFRLIQVDSSTVLDPVCYNQCINCFPLNTVSLSKNDVVLYPNPTKNYLYTNELIGTHKIVIRNLIGKIVLDTIVSNNNPINISSLNTGIYIVELNNKKYKIIKE